MVMQPLKIASLVHIAQFFYFLHNGARSYTAGKWICLLRLEQQIESKHF